MKFLREHDVVKSSDRFEHGQILMHCGAWVDALRCMGGDLMSVTL